MIPLALEGSRDFTHYIGLQIDLIEQPKSILQRLSNGTYSMNYSQNKDVPSTSLIMEKGLILGFNLGDDDSSQEDFQSVSSSTKLQDPVHLSFMEKVPDLIHVLSLRGLFLHISPESCKRLLEWDYTEVVGHKFSEFVHPSDLVTVMRDLRNCSAEGSVNFICRMKRKTSGYIYMEMNGHVCLPNSS
jgi:hypothetical protein